MKHSEGSVGGSGARFQGIVQRPPRANRSIDMTTQWVSRKEKVVFTHKNKNTVCVAIPVLDHLLVMLLRRFIVHREQWSRAVVRFEIGQILKV
jgi:hypothetical protein